MVLLGNGKTLERSGLVEDSVTEDPVLLPDESDGGAVWVSLILHHGWLVCLRSMSSQLPVHGKLTNVIMELAQRPGMALVKGGESADQVSESWYVARAKYEVRTWHFLPR